MPTQVVHYTYPQLYLPRWQVHIPAARPQDGHTLYFPVAFFCEFLGIDKRKQVAALRRDGRYLPEVVLREVPFNLSGVGWRMVLSIRKAELALWLVGIDPLRCKLEVQDRIAELQHDVMEAADRLLFGAAPAAPREQRGQVTYEQREEIRFACLECGAVHRILIENGAVTVLPAGNDGSQ